MAGGEHEAVAIGPGWIGRVEFEKAAKQHGGDVRCAHRQAGMTRFGLFDRVHRQRANGIGHAVVVGTRNRTRVRMSDGGKGRRLRDSVRGRKTTRLGHDACNGTRNGACNGNLQSRRDPRCRYRGNRPRTDNMRSIQVNSTPADERRHAQAAHRSVDVFPRHDVSFCR